MTDIADIACKGCGGADLCKNGIVRSHQRYLCKSCGMNFTNTPPRGKPAAMKDMALAMHTVGGMSFCGIAKILGVSDVSVLNWVRAKAKTLPDVPPPAPSAEPSGGGTPVILDEMWHYVKKKLQSSGYGELSIRLEKELSHGFSASATTRPAKSFSKRSE